VDPDKALSISIGGYEIRCRLPNSLDLMAIANNTDVDSARETLLERCLLEVQREGQIKSLSEMPSEVVDEVVSRMAISDPQADMQLIYSCPECGKQRQAAFDVVTFLWSEINAWAIRILQEVHTLASAYGWSETEILAMSPTRRGIYLGMVNG
ncbi:MAG: phage baseplate protein, partial [Planctomycetes bacterium]|nr:phage baseplate protein [Planctomycetota bacterium]